MTIELLTYILGGITIATALLVILSKHPVRSVLYLVLTFFMISGHYVLLNAQFLAIVNIIVYAGAIMVLFLFVLMLLNLNDKENPKKNDYISLISVLSGGALFLVILSVLKEGLYLQELPQMSTKGLVEELGNLLFTKYVLPRFMNFYLILSLILFCIGIIGLITRKNMIILLMCIELMLNAVNLLLVSFSAFYKHSDPQIFVFFIIVVAAAEATIGLSIIIMAFRNNKSTDISLFNQLKG